VSKVTDINPDMTQLKFLCEAGQCLAMNSRYGLATEIFQAVIALSPQKSLGYTLLGDAYLNMDRVDDALKSHQKAVEVDPDNTFARVHLGQTYLFKKQKDKGMAELKKVVEKDPNGVDASLARQLMKAAEMGVFNKI
jgi:cytochrome c-type biogenesis protein CcmH/NrfG